VFWVNTEILLEQFDGFFEIVLGVIELSGTLKDIISIASMWGSDDEFMLSSLNYLWSS
jgi:hypothetical protein